VQDTAQPIRRSRGVSLSDGCSSPYSSAARRTTSVLYHGISLFLSFNVIAEVGTMLSLFTTSITMPFFDFSVCVCVRACVRACVCFNCFSASLKGKMRPLYGLRAPLRPRLASHAANHPIVLQRYTQYEDQLFVLYPFRIFGH